MSGWPVLRATRRCLHSGFPTTLRDPTTRSGENADEESLSSAPRREHWPKRPLPPCRRSRLLSLSSLAPASSLARASVLHKARHRSAARKVGRYHLPAMNASVLRTVLLDGPSSFRWRVSDTPCPCFWCCQDYRRLVIPSWYYLYESKTAESQKRLAYKQGNE